MVPKSGTQVKSFKVLENRILCEGTHCLRTERPASTIRAGQCFSVGLSSLGINREYSMYSAANDEFVEFLIRVVPDGVVSPWLAKCAVGDLVEIGGPYGDFCLAEDDVKTRDFVFIATGTGIAPFHSFIRTFPSLEYRVYHGIRHEVEQYDIGDYDTSRYEAAISRPTNGTIVTQRVTDLIENANLSNESLYYLCGNQKMITDVIAILLKRGIPGGSIFTETFF